MAHVVPGDSHGHAPTVNFFVRDNHCFWYGKVLSELGVDKRPGAANAISQSFAGGVYGEEPPSSDSEEEEIDDFKDRQVAELFKSHEPTLCRVEARA